MDKSVNRIRKILFPFHIRGRYWWSDQKINQNFQSKNLPISQYLQPEHHRHQYVPQEHHNPCPEECQTYRYEQYKYKLHPVLHFNKK